MSSLSSRLLALITLIGAAVVAVVVVAGLSSGGTATAQADPDGCAPTDQTVVNVAYTQATKGCEDDRAEDVSWTYQSMSTARSDRNPYVGTPQQQWLATGAFAAGLAGIAAVRRRVRQR